MHCILAVREPCRVSRNDKKKKSWVLAFRNNSTMKILTFKNVYTSDTCSSWIKRFLLKSDEDGKREIEPFFPQGNQPWGYLHYFHLSVKGAILFCGPILFRQAHLISSATVRPEAYMFRMPTIMCVFFWGVGVVKMRSLSLILLLSWRFRVGVHG